MQNHLCILLAIRDLFENMDMTANSIPPIVMLQVLHMCYPQFAEKAEGGQGFQQQVINWKQLPRCKQTCRTSDQKKNLHISV